MVKNKKTDHIRKLVGRDSYTVLTRTDNGIPTCFTSRPGRASYPGDEWSRYSAKLCYCFPYARGGNESTLIREDGVTPGRLRIQ